jgi:hypothetical protein
MTDKIPFFFVLIIMKETGSKYSTTITKEEKSRVRLTSRSKSREQKRRDKPAEIESRIAKIQKSSGHEVLPSEGDGGDESEEITPDDSAAGDVWEQEGLQNYPNGLQ